MMRFCTRQAILDHDKWVVGEAIAVVHAGVFAICSEAQGGFVPVRPVRFG